MIYAYGICERASATRLPPRRGLGRATLRALATDGLAAIFTRHRSFRPSMSRGMVLAHERVVEAMMDRGAVLPLRFGTQLEGEDALAAVLTERRDELLGALERVRGKVELGLRVIPQPGADRELGARQLSGRSYILARAREHRRRERAAVEVHRPLAELAAASTLRAHPMPPALLVAAYLVDAERVDEFRASAAEFEHHAAGAQVVVTGPWPPYNFVGEEAA